MEYPDTFGSAGCLSTHGIGSYDTLNNLIPMKFVTYLNENLSDFKNHKIYFDFRTKTLDTL